MFPVFPLVFLVCNKLALLSKVKEAPDATVISPSILKLNPGFTFTTALLFTVKLQADKFVVAVGNSEDKTLELIQNISPEKLEIIETVWDDSLREGGRVLALETDKQKIEGR